MGDPDHLKGFNVNALYSHWLTRQKNGLEPFVILNSSPQHGTAVKKSQKAKGKERKIDYVEVDSEEEEGEERGDTEDQEHDIRMDENGENEGEVNEDVNEEKLPPAKLGPPIGKRKKNSKNLIDHDHETAPVPGPSTLPSQKLALKIKNLEDKNSPDSRQVLF